MGGTIEPSGPDMTAGVALADLPENQPIMAQADGEPVVLVRRGSQVNAVAAACTHYGASLADGIVVDGQIRCPWHHACFGIETGEATGAPALDPVTCYAVQVEGDLVKITGKLPPRPAVPPSRVPSSVVIAGAGAAGAALAMSLRHGGYTGPLTMVGDEPPSPVDRTNLSKDYLAGTAPEEWVPIRPRAYWREHDVDLKIDPARTIDVNRKLLHLESGSSLSYDALVLATGADAVRLPLPGATRENVFTLRTLADARGLIAALGRARRAVVIGSGFIGLEVAASLRARGLEVDVVGRDEIPLSRLMGAAIGQFLQTVHEERGVRFHNGTSPVAIHADTVELSDGRRLAADLVVMGVGARPRTALAQTAGLRIEDGVVVDAFFRTGAPDIYAVGDIARYPEPRLGRLVRIEHWVVAQRQAEAVARTLLGRGRPFDDVPFFWSQHHDVSIAFVGHAPSWDAVEIQGNLPARDATVIYRKDGQIQAVATIGRDRQGLAVEAAMRTGNQDAITAALGS